MNNKPTEPSTADIRAAHDDRPCCSCNQVAYQPIQNDDGTMSERWKCVLCGSEFIKHFWLKQAQSRLDAVDRVIAANSCAGHHVDCVVWGVDTPCLYCQIKAALKGKQE